MYRDLGNNKGTITVISAIIMSTMIGFIGLGVDTGYIYTVRGQMQNAADSAAMAGAAYLHISNTCEAKHKAREQAIDFALKNSASNIPVSISAQDIEFFPAYPERPTRIKVTAKRTKATNNGVPTIFASFLPIGMETVDVTVTATAALMSVKAVGGLRPWAVRDKWVDYDEDGELDDGEYIGYSDDDLGEQVILKYGNDDGRPMPQWFNPVDLPPLNRGTPITGADEYRELIENGYNDTVEIGDQLQIEPGNMTGPTESGVGHLINEDSGAYWDGTKIEGSAWPEMKSPRIVKIAFYDPYDLPSGGQNDFITVIKFGAFFIEDKNVSGGEGSASDNVMGRFIKIITNDTPGDEFPTFIANVSLVE